MTTQIAVRLPDDLVSFVDETIRRDGGSRAAVVTSALREMRRRAVAEGDAEILRQAGDYEDFDGLVSTTTLDDLA